MSGGFLLRLGALPGPGKTHSIAALLQFEHGCRLSHLTFRFLQVTHDREFSPEAPFVPFVPFAGGVALFALAEAESLGGLLLHWLRLF